MEKSIFEEHARSAAANTPVATRAGVAVDREIVLSVIAIAFTLFASVLVGHELSMIFLQQLGESRWIAAGGHLVFVLIVVFLVYGGLVYQFTRLAYLVRCNRHRPTTDAELERLWDGQAPSLAVLVPSYMEEPAVVGQTLLAAALQDYPNRRVVLLIDDSPTCQNEQSYRLLSEARALPDQINAMLRPAHQQMMRAQQDFILRQKPGRPDLDEELSILADQFEIAADFFARQANGLSSDCHVSRLLRDKFFLPEHDRLAARSAELRHARYQPHHFTCAIIRREYRRLASLFSAEVTSFERKLYENLSHQSNKAMNLNAYIGLMGGRFVEKRCDGRVHLVAADTTEASMLVPDADYLITLDADSLILPDYAKRLVWLAEQAANRKVAVLQTPYSAFPGAPGLLERIAGATTDIQYQIHQGFTDYAATYWVGANALLRKQALIDIAVPDSERGFDITIFIQDRTVIEDTESTVDLIDRGWSLYNYPERLAYSATPPDFGSLLIQRRRWANGGLIILPKLLRYIYRSAFSRGWLAESLLRIHYLVSIAVINFGLVIILAFPFSESIQSIWLPLTALPYFLLYARDLGLTGYRTTDVFRTYALNLVLIPVNIGGVCKSIQQAVTREKIPFARTPKVKGRTAVAPLYILALYVLMFGLLFGALVDTYAGRVYHALFATFNLVFLTYGFKSFVGFRTSIVDIRVFLRTARTATLQEDTATATVVPLRGLAQTHGSEIPASHKVMARNLSETLPTRVS